MSEQKEIILPYKVIKITTTSFSYNDLEEQQIADLFLQNEGHLNLKIEAGLDISLDKSEISFEIRTHLSNKKENDLLISHTGKTIFAVQNLAQTFLEEEEQFNLPDNFIVQLYALSYSHARALLATELSRTAYKDVFYLPVTDPTKILNK